MVMAAVWQEWTGPEGEAMRTCAIVTVAANGRMAEIHHRMPVLVKPDDFGLWLGENGHGAAVLMEAAPDEDLVQYRVSRAVNSNRASGPELIEPFEPEKQN